MSDHHDTPTRPPLCPQRRLPQLYFRGSITQLKHWLSTLRRVDYSTTTQDSLPVAGQALPDGVGYPQDSTERFQTHIMFVILPSQASWRKDILLLRISRMSPYYTSRSVTTNIAEAWGTSGKAGSKAP